MKESPYFVWRRNDGYVAASRTKPRDWVVPSTGERVTFHHLGEFEVWADERALIEKELVRVKGPLPLG